MLTRELATLKCLVEPRDNQVERKERIQFLTSAFKINTTQGSNDSVEWLNQLADVNNLDLFRSDITIFIELKWNMDYPLIFTFGMINILYSILLIIDSNMAENSAMKIVCIIYSFFMLTFEGFQAYGHGKEAYFADILNYFDFISQSLYILYAIIWFSDVSQENMVMVHVIHVIALAISGIRGLTNLRIFK